jgi:hypothetical protein
MIHPFNLIAFKSDYLSEFKALVENLKNNSPGQAPLRTTLVNKFERIIALLEKLGAEDELKDLKKQKKISDRNVEIIQETISKNDMRRRADAAKALQEEQEAQELEAAIKFLTEHKRLQEQIKKAQLELDASMLRVAELDGLLESQTDGAHQIVEASASAQAQDKSLNPLKVSIDFTPKSSAVVQKTSHSERDYLAQCRVDAYRKAQESKKEVNVLQAQLVTNFEDLLKIQLCRSNPRGGRLSDLLIQFGFYAAPFPNADSGRIDALLKDISTFVKSPSVP